MVFLASLLIARFALFALIDSFIPGNAAYADADILAIWYFLFGATDAAGVILLLSFRRACILTYVIYLSACWSCLLALEQVARMDTLQAYDTSAQIIITTAVLLAAAWEAVKWIKARPQSSSLRP